MGVLFTILRALVLVGLAVFLISTTVMCAVLFAVATWDIVRGRLPLQPPARRDPVDDLAEQRARRNHPARPGRTG